MEKYFIEIFEVNSNLANKVLSLALTTTTHSLKQTWTYIKESDHDVPELKGHQKMESTSFNSLFASAIVELSLLLVRKNLIHLLKPLEFLLLTGIF